MRTLALLLALGFVTAPLVPAVAWADDPPVPPAGEVRAAAATAPATPAGAATDEKFATHPQAAILAPVDAMALRALDDGYNAEDAAAYYRDFSATMKPACTPAAFKALVLGVWKAKWGPFEGKRKLLDRECSLTPEIGIVMYKAKFAKGVAKLAVSYAREGAVLKLTNLQVVPAAQPR